MHPSTAANSMLGLGLLAGQQPTYCQLVWAHLQLVLVLGLTRDQGRSLTARLCRWTRLRRELQTIHPFSQSN